MKKVIIIGAGGSLAQHVIEAAKRLIIQHLLSSLETKAGFKQPTNSR
ncbi:hypothetical protein [Mucilaginibacter xinganensis]|nr:hypothetical protein [Mucilaginibacter xinganensis]